MEKLSNLIKNMLNLTKESKKKIKCERCGDKVERFRITSKDEKICLICVNK